MTTTNGTNQATPQGVEYMIVNQSVKLGIIQNFPNFSKVEERRVNYPAMIVRKPRQGSPLTQHNQILNTIPDYCEPTYHITATEDYRYHYYNIKGKGRAKEMLNHYLEMTKETRKYNPIPFLNQEVNPEYVETITQGVSRPDLTPQDIKEIANPQVINPKNYVNLNGANMKPNFTNPIPITCPRCKHTTQVNPINPKTGKPITRARCGGQVNGKTCMKDITALLKKAIGEPVQVKPGRPKKSQVTPVTPEVNPITEPQDNIVSVNPPPVETIEPIPEPQPIPSTIPKPQIHVTKPQPIPPQPVTPPSEVLFSIDELAVLVKPLHKMEQKLVNAKMPDTIDNEMIDAMDKSLGVILNKIQEMFPDKAFLIAVVTYLSTQGIILGNLFLETQKEKKQIATNQAKKGRVSK